MLKKLLIPIAIVFVVAVALSYMLTQSGLKGSDALAPREPPQARLDMPQKSHSAESQSNAEHDDFRLRGKRNESQSVRREHSKDHTLEKSNLGKDAFSASHGDWREDYPPRSVAKTSNLLDDKPSPSFFGEGSKNGLTPDGRDRPEPSAVSATKEQGLSEIEMAKAADQGKSRTADAPAITLNGKIPAALWTSRPPRNKAAMAIVGADPQMISVTGVVFESRGAEKHPLIGAKVYDPNSGSEALTNESGTYNLSCQLIEANSHSPLRSDGESSQAPTQDYIEIGADLPGYRQLTHSSRFYETVEVGTERTLQQDLYVTQSASRIVELQLSGDEKLIEDAHKTGELRLTLHWSGSTEKLHLKLPLSAKGKMQLALPYSTNLKAALFCATGSGSSFLSARVGPTSEIRSAPDVVNIEIKKAPMIRAQVVIRDNKSLDILKRVNTTHEELIANEEGASSVWLFTDGNGGLLSPVNFSAPGYARTTMSECLTGAYVTQHAEILVFVKSSYEIAVEISLSPLVLVSVTDDLSAAKSKKDYSELSPEERAFYFLNSSTESRNGSVFLIPWQTKNIRFQHPTDKNVALYSVFHIDPASWQGEAPYRLILTPVE